MEVDVEITAAELVVGAVGVGSEQHEIRGDEMFLLFLLGMVKVNFDWDGNDERR